MKKFKELVPGDNVWMLELGDETIILNKSPEMCTVTESLHYNDDFEYDAIMMLVPSLKGEYECRVDDKESISALTDPYWIVATSEEEALNILNNPEKYGFRRYEDTAYTFA